MTELESDNGAGGLALLESDVGAGGLALLESQEMQSAEEGLMPKYAGYDGGQ